MIRTHRIPLRLTTTQQHRANRFLMRATRIYNFVLVHPNLNYEEVFDAYWKQVEARDAYFPRDQFPYVYKMARLAEERGANHLIERLYRVRIQSPEIVDGHVYILGLGTISCATVTQDDLKPLYVELYKTDKKKWALTYAFEGHVDPLPPVHRDVGVDLGILDPVVCSDGKKYWFPPSLQNAIEALLDCQTRFRNCEDKGSSRASHLQKKEYVLTRRISNLRKSYYSQVGGEIAKTYDRVYLENLEFPHPTASGKQLLYLSAKLEASLTRRGREVIRIDRYFPSTQICHDCGARTGPRGDLSIRSWTCAHCHAEQDRDVNAALNIRDEGRRVVARDPRAYAW